MYPSHTHRMEYPETIITKHFNHNEGRLEVKRSIHYKLSDYRRLAFYTMEWVLSSDNASKLIQTQHARFTK